MSYYSYLLKYIIIGDSSVGKTCLSMQFTNGKFQQDSQETIGMDFASKLVELQSQKLKMQIWDTAGKEVFKFITRSYYRGCIGALLVYDITNRQTFNNLSMRLEEIRKYANQKLTIILVGNKNDLQNKREVSQSEASNFAQSHGIIYLEASAKDHLLVQHIFLKLTSEILHKIDSKQIDPKNETLGIKLGSHGNEQKGQGR